MKKILFILILFFLDKASCQNKISSKVRFINILETSNIYDYNKKDNDSLSRITSNFNPIETQIFSINKDDYDVIKLLTKLKIKYNNKMYVFIKYFLKKKEKEVLNIDVYELIDNNYVKNTSKDNFLITVENLLRLSNSKILFEFYNQNDSQKYIEINKLKPSVKEVNGTLNLYKLSKIIEENKSTLSKYLDE
ncbi:hypothetical protein [Flavobacterium davisii]|uniref:hypothetical protein n=1 Tax=Flavobacterium davisii TaxID=2906077 RepID=UPI0035CFA902